MNVPAITRRQHNLEQVCVEARTCRRCELYQNVTQTVFGEGPVGARIFFVDEQPGDTEDIGGRPLIGPAGRLFDTCLNEVGIKRERCYITNAVKHFRHTQRGRRRLHQRPSTSHIEACRWWLQREIELVAPPAHRCAERSCRPFSFRKADENCSDTRHPSRVQEPPYPCDDPPILPATLTCPDRF